MAGLPEAANILIRESCRLPRTGKGEYTLKDDQFCAILLCTTVTDHKTYSTCIADNNVYDHERKGKRGAQVGGHIHWVIRKVRRAHIICQTQPSCRRTSRRRRNECPPHPPRAICAQVRKMFERVIVDEHGQTQRDCLENVREIRKYRTRLANSSEDDVILRGLVYMNQFKDTILKHFKAWEPDWNTTGERGEVSEYAKCIKHLSTVRTTRLQPILRNKEKVRRSSAAQRQRDILVPRAHVLATVPVPVSALLEARSVSEVGESWMVQAQPLSLLLTPSYATLKDGFFTAYTLHARRPDGTGLVSTLSTISLILSEEALDEATFWLHEAKTGAAMQLTPHITTQNGITVRLHKLTRLTGSLYKIGVSYGSRATQFTEAFETVTKVRHHDLGRERVDTAASALVAMAEMSPNVV